MFIPVFIGKALQRPGKFGFIITGSDKFVGN